MTNHDLYRVLGLRRSATQRAVHAAYRRLSKAAHPDGGGDQAGFELLKLARDVLHDPERRARYDADGSYDQTAADPGRAMLLQAIVQALGEVLVDLAKARRQAIQVDLAAELRARLAAHAAEEEAKAAQIRTNAAALVPLLGRWSAPAGAENVVEALLRGQVEQMARIADNADRLAKGWRDAAMLIEGYAFRYDDPTKQIVSVMIGAGTSTATGVHSFRFA